MTGRPDLTPPEFVERIGPRAFYRPVLSANFHDALQLCIQAVSWAREQGCADMLVNVYGILGLENITTFMRYEIAVAWAQAAGSLRVALVVPDELMDPQKFAMLMAHNRGVNGDVFITEAEALRWLNARV
jgi:hypothetical protein